MNTVIAVSSRDKRPKDEEYVEQKKDKNIFLWSAQEIEYIERLIAQVGSAAKYQLYSIIFANKKQKSLGIPCPAIKGKIAGNTFYTFLISAKQLLKYAYVHHRELTGIIETSQVYQRMLRQKKLKDIATFVDRKDGYFPNSIIVNFSKEPGWDPAPLRDKEKTQAPIGDTAVGHLRLPEYFGSAWVIDGQHRLYGAAQAKTDVLVPVLAFVNMEQIEQANLFVEINKEQTAVPANLLWDLYSDIYRDSSDEKQKFLYQIAETAKRLNSIGPLEGCIDIPSAPATGNIELTLTTICEAIKRLSPCWDYFVHSTYESRTLENVSRIINTYFEVLESLWPEDWGKGSGVLLTNGGFGVLTLIFRDILNHIAYKYGVKRTGTPGILQAHKVKEFKQLLETYLKPVIEYLKTDGELQKTIRKTTGRGLQNDIAGILELKIQDFVRDFSSPLIDLVPKIPSEKEPPVISIIEDKSRLAEKSLRDFVLENLKRAYGSSSNQWWKQGLPGDIKQAADDRWSAEVKRIPYLQQQKVTNEEKFAYLDLGQLMNTIIYGQNWDLAFKDVFGEKANLQRRIQDVMVLRNPSTHGRKIDDQHILDGTASLRWLSKCIGEPDLNPYT
ncbi:MAG: DGQHR domain-containing protein [Sedimentisphaerales bacterium]|nr:DGQHR domain-containing protein [Sedimentisphaerales bacterium]